MSEIILTADISDEGTRLDKFISDNSELSRSLVQNIIETGSVTVNGKAVAKSCKLKNGDRICFSEPEPEPLEIEPQNIPLDIRYEDDDLLVVNKPKGMVVHPAPGNNDSTLVNALLAYCGDSLSGINGVLRPGIVHRIDKDTSGLLIVAKNDFAHRGLAEQIKEHSFTRKYQAVVYNKNGRNVMEHEFSSEYTKLLLGEKEIVLAGNYHFSVLNFAGHEMYQKDFKKRISNVSLTGKKRRYLITYEDNINLLELR